MQKINKKGFTIIELIVVIAIIAVLAGIVLVNVTQYINKGKDAAIQTSLGGLTTVVTKIAEENGDMLNLCITTDFTYAIQAARTASGGDSKLIFCHDATSNPDAPCMTGRWVAGVQLASSANYYCVDWSGIKREVSSVPTDCNCPAS